MFKLETMHYDITGFCYQWPRCHKIHILKPHNFDEIFELDMMCDI